MAKRGGDFVVKIDMAFQASSSLSESLWIFLFFYLTLGFHYIVLSIFLSFSAFALMQL